MERLHHFLDAQFVSRPDSRAFSDTVGYDWSYRDLDAAVTELVDLFVRSGVMPGDRVMVLAENCCAVVAVVLAASRLHATAVPINARQTQAEVTRLVGHVSPAVILMTDQVSSNAADHADHFGAAVVCGDFGRLRMTIRESNPDPEDDVAVQLYTTGTTGTPKGVMLTHANVRFGGVTSAGLRNMTPDDLIYGVLPLTHVFGLASIMAAALYVGVPVRFEARFSADKLYTALTEGVTLLSAVPQMHALLMQYAKEQGFDHLPGSTLRYVSSGAAPLDPAWKRKAEAFYGVAIQNGYGMTETTAGTCATSNEIGDPDTSVGPALPGIEVRIDETVLGGGNGAGEVLTRGPNIMKGYYKNPEETARVLDADGWMHTGDLGRIDDKGHLHILGRSKELIIHGGFNVYPPEVEAALNDHPQVIQAAVVGQIVDGDEKVVAFCQVADHDRPDVEALRNFAAERLAGYKRPTKIVLALTLPAAPTGKILKHKLLDHFAEDLAGD